MTTEFKIGDKVGYLGPNTNINTTMAKAGATAIVTSPRYFSKTLQAHLIDVKWDRNALAGSQLDGGYIASQFELISEEPCIVLHVYTYRECGDWCFQGAFTSKADADVRAKFLLECTPNRPVRILQLLSESNMESRIETVVVKKLVMKDVA